MTKNPIKVGDVMVSGGLCIEAEASLTQALVQMRQNRLGWLAVLEGPRIVGSLLRGGIQQALDSGRVDPVFTCVREVMSPLADSCTFEQDLNVARQIMQERKLEYMPVVDEHGVLLGVLPKSASAGRASPQGAV